MRTEEELARALREGAERAPDTDLLAGVARLRRRRTRRRAQVLAAAAVIAVAGTGTVVLGPGEGPRPATVTPGPAAVSELWPQALFTMPTSNAEGGRYRPVTALSATQVLLAAESSFENGRTFEIYETETGTARVVTRVPRRKGLRKYFPQSTTAGPADMAWSALGERADGTPVRDIWTAPLAGGPARLLATRTGRDADLDAIAIGGDHVLWSETGGGVWRVPLTGGDPERVPGGEGLHLIAWPWAADVTSGPAGRGRNQTRLVNLADGTTRTTAAPPGVTGWRCGPVWCHGRSGDGLLIQRTDGTGTPRTRQISGGRTHAYPALDRFLVGTDVYDLATDRPARLDGPTGWHGAGTSSEPSTILYWDAAEKGAFRVLNLAAVPPAQ